MTLDEFLRMKLSDVQKVDENALTDINNIHIDQKSLPLDRLISYTEQTNNPFCFICEGVVVKLNYLSNGQTIEEALVKHFLKYKS